MEKAMLEMLADYPTLASWMADDGKWSTVLHLAAGDAQTKAQGELRELLMRLDGAEAMCAEQEARADRAEAVVASAREFDEACEHPKGRGITLAAEKLCAAVRDHDREYRAPVHADVCVGRVHDSLGCSCGAGRGDK
jgi:hypothetical protein